MHTLKTDYSHPILPISQKGHHSDTYLLPSDVQSKGTLTLTAFPRAVQEIECPFHPLPVLEVEKGVGDSFAVASLQDVLWRQDQALRLQEVLEQMWRNSDCSAGPLGFICQV